jgi:hypothetical protein
MKNLIIAVAILAFFAGMATARGPQEVTPVPADGTQHSRGTVVWYDDMESGAPGWTHGDDSAQPYYWHIDSYMAYSGNSWWCGSSAITADGGYGNLWKQYLTSPYIPTVGTYPAVSFMVRYDSEYNFDFTYVQAESLGAWENLNRGYTGTAAWAPAAFGLVGFDNPAKVRFFFESDGGWSDADGDYLSVGGGVAVDDVVIFDYLTYAEFFRDDADANVGLIPSVPAAAGDYWTLDSNPCRAFTGSGYWDCTFPDTTLVPPNLQCWVKSPDVDISMYAAGTACTSFFIFQFHMPGDQGGSWQEIAIADGFEFITGWWHGNQCDYGYGPCSHFGWQIPIVGLGGVADADIVAVKFLMMTDSFGNTCDPVGCPTYCSAGFNFDDVSFEVTEPSPVEDSSWGKIKSLYR